MILEPRQVAVLMVAGAVFANLAFVGLGAAFDYPDVLDQPAAQTLAEFRNREVLVGSLFVLLAAGATLMAPIAAGLRRLDPNPRRGRMVLLVGVAAAAVQVCGLLRWPLIVPWLARRAADPQHAGSAAAAFDTIGTVLGTAIGETLGYLLTAVWTVLVVRALAGRWLPRVGIALGAISAALVLTGVAAPFGVAGADQANFLGYVLWTAWLVVVAVALWRRSGPRAAVSAAVPGSVVSGSVTPVVETSFSSRAAVSQPLDRLPSGSISSKQTSVSD